MMVSLEDLGLTLGEVNGGYEDWALQIGKLGLVAYYTYNGVTQSFSVIF